MAADQERADRIRALKQERPDLTWRRIADHVGVSERAATDWQKKGGIEYANAEKLAGLFEVDVDYIWRGTDNGTPSPFEPQDAHAAELAAINERLDRLETLLQRVFEHRSEQGQDIIGRLDGLERALTERTDALLPGVQELLAEAQAAQPAGRSRSARTAK